MKKIYTLFTLFMMSMAVAAAQDAGEQLMIETYDEISTPVGTPVAIEAIMAYGTAPYTVQWVSPGNKVLEEQHLDELPLDVLSFTVTPGECGDYIVRVTDADNATAADTVRVITTGDAVAATFESLYLPAEGYYNGASADGSDRYGSFVNGSFSFNTNNEFGGAFWYGFAYSNSKSAVYESIADQYKSVTGGGCDGSDNFVLCYHNSFGTAPVITALNSDMGTTLKGCYITNSAYVYNSMTKGDAFTQPLAPGGWFKVTFTADNGKSVDYYLADLRSDDANEHYVLDQWDWVDLSSLGLVKTVTISVSGSDIGVYGLNTPAYFCLDNFNDTKHATPVHPTVAGKAQRGGATTYYGVDGARYSAARKGINIMRLNDGRVVKMMR